MALSHAAPRPGVAPRQLQLVPVCAPPAADEGRVRECPICLEETRANAAWVVFPCAHATCRPCYERLTAKPQQDAACPLCRAPLKEPAPGAMEPHSSLYAPAWSVGPEARCLAPGMCDAPDRCWLLCRTAGACA